MWWPYRPAPERRACRPRRDFPVPDVANRKGRQMRRLGWAATTAAVLLVLAGCGQGAGNGTGSGPCGITPPNIPKQASLGPGEGTVNIVSWAGYVEDGSNDKTVDWVHSFEQATGCKVNNKVAGT